MVAASANERNARQHMHVRHVASHCWRLPGSCAVIVRGPIRELLQLCSARSVALSHFEKVVLLQACQYVNASLLLSHSRLPTK
jgi:hypothetical protein